jgi:hypothetical protein
MGSAPGREITGMNQADCIRNHNAVHRILCRDALHWEKEEMADKLAEKAALRKREKVPDKPKSPEPDVSEQKKPSGIVDLPRVAPKNLQKTNHGRKDVIADKLRKLGKDAPAKEPQQVPNKPKTPEPEMPTVITSVAPKNLQDLDPTEDDYEPPPADERWNSQKAESEEKGAENQPKQLQLSDPGQPKPAEEEPQVPEPSTTLSKSSLQTPVSVLNPMETMMAQLLANSERNAAEIKAELRNQGDRLTKLEEERRK